MFGHPLKPPQVASEVWGLETLFTPFAVLVPLESNWELKAPSAFM